MAVFTEADIAGFRDPMPIGTPFLSAEHGTMAVDTVRWSAIRAVVVARDRYAERDAGDAGVGVYEPLPAVVAPEQRRVGFRTLAASDVTASALDLDGCR